MYIFDNPFFGSPFFGFQHITLRLLSLSIFPADTHLLPHVCMCHLRIILNSFCLSDFCCCVYTVTMAHYVSWDWTL